MTMPETKLPETSPRQPATARSILKRGALVAGAATLSIGLMAGLADNFLNSSPEYDFIFCRQLLIYLDEATQTRLIRTLHRALTRQGVIFVGAGETELVHKPEFVPIEIPGAGAFLKAGKSRVREATETARCLRPLKPDVCARAARLSERFVKLTILLGDQLMHFPAGRHGHRAHSAGLDVAVSNLVVGDDRPPAVAVSIGAKARANLRLTRRYPARFFRENPTSDGR